jgi:putative oxidoreductase
MHMELGLLILRAALGGLMVGHSSQKLFGWFGGAGPTLTGAVFEQFGLRPGRAWALFAGTAELIAAMLIILGLAFPLGPSIVLASMIVAVVITAQNSFWMHSGPGCELPLLYGANAVVLGYTGPGAWSFDKVTVPGIHNGAIWGTTALLVAALGAAPFIVLRKVSLSVDRRASAATG